MTTKPIKRLFLALGLGAASFSLSACDGVTVGVGYGYDPFYELHALERLLPRCKRGC